MAYVNNPSIPAFPVSTQTEVKTAITNIANWIIAFNTKLGDTIGEYNGYGTANYSSSLLNFVQKAMIDDKVVYNTLQKLTSRITESHLTADLNTRINLIDDPGTGLVSQISQISSNVDDNTASIETLTQVTDGVKAEYTVKLNTNNKIAGFGLMLEEGEPSTFEILANRFAVVNTDGITSTVPFFVEDSNVYMNNAIIHEINADNIIANGTIKSPSIQGGSLNGTSGTFTGSLIAATGTFAGTLSAGVVDLTNTVGQNFTYPNAGNYTVFTMPYVGTVRFTIVGGGGGGAGGSRYDSRGGGGYAGSVTTATITNVPMGTSISVSIGAGGSAGINGTNGGAGGTTSININGYNYTASGGAGGTVGNMINNMTVYYHTNDYGDFATTSTSAGNAASYSGSIGGARGGSIFGQHWGVRCAAGDPSTLNGGAGVRGGGGGGGAATNVWVGNRGFYQDPVDGDGGDGLPPSSGGVGGAGFAFIEIWNPNGVVLYDQYKTLVTWLNGTSIGPVPAGAW